MKIRACASSLIVAGFLAASGAAGAQQPYPDLKGTWTGQVSGVAHGKIDHWPNTGETGPIFREGSWTLVIDRQEGNRFTGTQGLTEGTQRDLVLGVIRADRRSLHMVDDDGTSLATLTGRDAMEVCRTEVTPDSRNVSCWELTRQR